MIRVGRNWSQAEYEQLRNTGTVPGRSKRAIARAKIRLAMRNKERFRRPWTAAEIQQLCLLYTQGHSAVTIAKRGLLPFSRMAIQKQLCRLGLAAKIEIRKLTPDQRALFKRFLQAHYEGKTPEDLARLWSAQYPRVPVDKKQVVRYLSNLRIKIPYGEVQSINKQRRREEKARAKAEAENLSPEKLVEIIRRDRVRVMARRFEKGRDVFTGLRLSQQALMDLPEVILERADGENNSDGRHV